MTDAQDIIHQIEYRWHDRWDLSPVASSMSQQSQRGWDSWIRTWVRHPHVDGLRESVRYQIQPAGRAALAWRFEHRQAAEREDGMRGRPLVSRVLAGQASLLTPAVAIVLCGTGLPQAAGPRPGYVGTETELSVIDADELSALVRDRTTGLDQDAARLKGLRQVVAAALSDPYTPLAIQLPDPYILVPPTESSQWLLLWGTWRVVWPLLGNTGRGWSFSTFEPPLGDVDPATLPDILFRQARDAPLAAPVRPRKELKVYPLQPMPADAPYADLAGWLVAEYAERGGDELARFIASSCGTEPSLTRLSKIYDEMRATQLPVTTSRPPEQVEPSPGQVRQSWFEKPDPYQMPSAYPEYPSHPEQPAHQEQPEYQEPSSRDDDVPGYADATRPAGTPEYDDTPEYDSVTEYDDTPEHADASRYTDAPERADAVRYDDIPGYEYDDTPEYDDVTRYLDASGYTPFEDPDEQFRAGKAQRVHAPPAPPALVVSDLLKRLPEAGDTQEFMSILQNILSPDAQSDDNERVKARREISKPGWYGKICEISDRRILVDILSEIFKVIVIPDLDKSEVSKKIAEWAGHEPSAVVGGLLAAAKQSGEGTWLTMSRALEPTLALRWTTDNDLQELYPVPAPQRGRDSGRGRLSNLFNRS